MVTELNVPRFIVLYKCLWFRDNGAGDSLLKLKVGAQKESEIDYCLENKRIDQEMPAFNRAMAFLETQGVKPILSGVK